MFQGPYAAFELFRLGAMAQWIQGPAGSAVIKSAEFGGVVYWACLNFGMNIRRLQSGFMPKLATLRTLGSPTVATSGLTHSNHDCMAVAASGAPILRRGLGGDGLGGAARMVGGFLWGIWQLPSRFPRSVDGKSSS